MVAAAAVAEAAPIPVTSEKLARQFPVANGVLVAVAAPASPKPRPTTAPAAAPTPTYFQSTILF